MAEETTSRKDTTFKERFSLDSEFMGTSLSMLQKNKPDCGIFISLILLYVLKDIIVFLGCWNTPCKKLKMEMSEVAAVENTLYPFCRKDIYHEISSEYFSLLIHSSLLWLSLLYLYEKCLKPYSRLYRHSTTVKLPLCVDTQLKH